MNQSTHLAVQSVAELGNAARDLVKVNRLPSSIALDDVKGHAGLMWVFVRVFRCNSKSVGSVVRTEIKSGAMPRKRGGHASGASQNSLNLWRAFTIFRLAGVNR